MANIKTGNGGGVGIWYVEDFIIDLTVK